MAREPGTTLPARWRQVQRAVLRGRSRSRRLRPPRTRLGRALTGVVCLVAGLLITVSALNARGLDLRPGRDTDLVSLVQSESRRNAELSRQVSQLRTDVDQLSAETADQPALAARTEQQARYAGLRAVHGPTVTVTLDDAPASVTGNGVDQDLLVVHQQDIQAVANVLWSGGAEAMTIQGQRVVSTTGIKCVGNTVVLHGIPYAPPYVIAAMGSPARLQAALSRSTAIAIYKQYVQAYGLGYTVRTDVDATFPAYQGSLDLRYAHVP